MFVYIDCDNREYALQHLGGRSFARRLTSKCHSAPHALLPTIPSLIKVTLLYQSIPPFTLSLNNNSFCVSNRYNGYMFNPVEPLLASLGEQSRTLFSTCCVDNSEDYRRTSVSRHPHVNLPSTSAPPPPPRSLRPPS